MEFEFYVCIKAIDTIGKNRSVGAAISLLYGKKSIQTVQDSFLFQVQYLYNIFPGQERQVGEIMNLLQKDNYFQVINKKIIVTDKGYNLLRKNEDEFAFLKELEPFVLQSQAKIFIARLLLFIQLLSNEAVQNNRFLPVVTNKLVQAWVKSFYFQYCKGKDRRAAVYEELFQALHTMPADFQNTFVDALTGSNRYGETKFQLAYKLGMRETEFNAWFSYYLQVMVKNIVEKKESFPVLSLFCTIEQKTLTSSANRTYELYLSGLAIEEIAKIRRLKQSTIEDHFIEIAYIFPGFPFERFLNENDYLVMKEMLRKNDQIRLGELKRKMHDSITYFQVRLAIAKWVKYDRENA